MQPVPAGAGPEEDFHGQVDHLLPGLARLHGGAPLAAPDGEELPGVLLLNYYTVGEGLPGGGRSLPDLPRRPPSSHDLRVQVRHGALLPRQLLGLPRRM